MDFWYLLLATVLWLVMAGMAAGCAALGGAKP